MTVFYDLDDISEAIEIFNQSFNFYQWEYRDYEAAVAQILIERLINEN